LNIIQNFGIKNSNDYSKVVDFAIFKILEIQNNVNSENKNNLQINSNVFKDLIFKINKIKNLNKKLKNKYIYNNTYYSKSFIYEKNKYSINDRLVESLLLNTYYFENILI
jgi:beta-glucanase (GH16 family)